MPRKKQGLGARGALAMKERLRKKNQIVEKAHKKTKLKYQKYGVRKKPGKVAKISGRAIGSYTAGSGRLGGSSRSGGSGRLGGGGKRSKIGGSQRIGGSQLHQKRVYPGGSALVGGAYLGDSAQVFQGNKNTYYPAFRREQRRLHDFKGRLAHKSGRLI